MSVFRRVPVLVAVTLLAGGLGGCGSISSVVAGSMGDLIPAWAGGLPADAPSRPGTARYEEWARQHQTQHSDAAASAATGGATSSVDAIH